MKRSVLARLQEGKWAPLAQFVRFGLVGASSTVIQYGTEMLCYYVLLKNVEFPFLTALLGRLGVTASGEQIRVVVSTGIAFVCSVTNSYYWNNRFVFGTGKKTVRQHVGTFFRSVSVYAVTGLIIAPGLKLVLGNAGWPFWLASLSTLVVTIPLNFLLNKFWAFGQKKGREPQ